MAVSSFLHYQHPILHICHNRQVQPQCLAANAFGGRGKSRREFIGGDVVLCGEFRSERPTFSLRRTDLFPCKSWNETALFGGEQESFAKRGKRSRGREYRGLLDKVRATQESKVYREGTELAREEGDVKRERVEKGEEEEEVEEGKTLVGVRRRAAFFDVDGTIVNSNVVSAYVKMKLKDMPPLEKLFWVPVFALKVVGYIILDSVDRGLFNRAFYRNYAGIDVGEKEKMAETIYNEYLKPRVFPSAVERIQELKRDGFAIVFVTGSLDFLVAPLATEVGADRVLAARLKERDGRFTGELEGAAVSSQEKGVLVKAYAAEMSMKLEDCHAYGDSIADVIMLESVGFPFVVRPDQRLHLTASLKGWTFLDWRVSESKV